MASMMAGSTSARSELEMIPPPPSVHSRRGPHSEGATGNAAQATRGGRGADWIFPMPRRCSRRRQDEALPARA
jgi:hypothetical protein